MKKIIMLTVIFVLLTAVLWRFGGRAAEIGRDILPAAWTAPGPDSRTISIRSYGIDQFLRQSLFGPTVRRTAFFLILSFYALVSLLALRKMLEGAPASFASNPRWAWTDLVWVFLGVTVFWGVTPFGDTFSTGVLLVKDVAVVIWIGSMARVRGFGVRSFGLAPMSAPGDGVLGILAAFLLAPALGLIVLAHGASVGPSFIPDSLCLPVPPSLASAWLAILFLPLFEEILFRGFLYRLLRSRSPEWIANIVTSLVFAAIHGQGASIGAGRFLGSLIMCKLFERTGTVWSSLGAHAAFNAMLLLGPKLF